MKPYMKTIKNIRKKHGMSQADMAKLLGIKHAAYSRYERCECDISVDKLIKICKHFKLSADSLLEINPARKHELFNPYDNIKDFKTFSS